MNCFFYIFGGTSISFAYALVLLRLLGNLNIDENLYMGIILAWGVLMMTIFTFGLLSWEKKLRKVMEQFFNR